MAALALRQRRRPAGIGLTPLIDVVFILMIFFMLASSFAQERQIDLETGRVGAGDVPADAWQLVVRPDSLELDGVVLSADAARQALAAGPRQQVIIRPADGASVQRVIDAADLARDAGAADVMLAR